MNHQRLADTLGALEQATLATIELFLEPAPREEREHVVRVAHLSVDVAILCGVREPHLSVLEYAARLHQVAAPALVVLRRNPAFTASVRLVEALPRAHEPNPRGAVHTPHFVPFGARILSVCDRVDTLMHDRTYPLTREQAVDVIRRERIVRYNAEVVDNLCELLMGTAPPRPDGVRKGMSQSA